MYQLTQPPNPYTWTAQGRGVVTWSNIILFLYGVAWAFTLDLGIGTLYLAEGLALLAIANPVSWPKIKNIDGLRPFVIAYLLLAAGLFVSDIYNSTPFGDAVRGISNPLLAISSVLFCAANMRRNPQGIVAVLVGIFLGNFIFGSTGIAIASGGDQDFYIQSMAASEYWFKVTVVPYLFPLVTVTAFGLARKKLILGGIALLFTSIFFIYLDARSSGLTLLIAGLGVLAFESRAPTARRVFPVVVTSVVLGYLAYVGYAEYLLSSDRLMNGTSQIRMMQNPYNPIAMLLEGRSEWKVAMDVIWDAIIFGHGSWAVDTTGWYTYLRFIDTDLPLSYQMFDRIELVPTHSVLLTGWIWGGVIGFSGTLLLLVHVLRVGKASLGTWSALDVIALVLVVQLVWDSLFSPLQAIRLSFPHSIAFLVVLIQHRACPSELRGSMRRERL